MQDIDVVQSDSGVAPSLESLSPGLQTIENAGADWTSKPSSTIMPQNSRLDAELEEDMFGLASQMSSSLFDD